MKESNEEEEEVSEKKSQRRQCERGEHTYNNKHDDAYRT